MTTTTNNTATVTQPLEMTVRPYDILCGRSKTCFNNIGNRRFRITISMNLRKFDSLKNRTERGNFIGTLASTLKDDAGFRFIRISKKHGRVELSDEEIRAKIGHALRDLSKAQAEAAANLNKPTQEAQKVFGMSSSMASSVTSSRPTTPVPLSAPSSSVQQPQQQEMKMNTKPSAAITVTPQLPQRQVMSDNHILQDTIRKEDYFPTMRSPYNDDDDISDISQEDHAADFRQAQHLPLEEMKMPPLVPTVTQQMQDYSKPAAPMIQYKTNQETLGDDDFCLMPLRFDEAPHQAMLGPVSMDFFDSPHSNKSRPAAASLRSTFDLDMDDSSIPYEAFQRRCSLS